MDTTRLIVRLMRIRYSGDNIGNDFKFSLFIDGLNRDFERKISHETTVRFGPNGSILVNKDLPRREFPHNIPIALTVTEQDVLDDRGSANSGGKFVIGYDQKTPLPFKLTVSVVGDQIGDSQRTGILELLFVASLIGDNEEAEEPGDESVEPPPEFIDSLRRTKSRLLGICSDVHIGVDKCKDDFDDFDESQFIAMLKWFRALKKGPQARLDKELVLLGDFLELWETSPYFHDYFPLKQKKFYTRSKIERIVKKREKLFWELRDFSYAWPVHYIPGNHDDELFDAEAQKYLEKVSSCLFNFGAQYENADFELYAEHGHRFDEYNYAKDPYGKTVYGRWNVENFSTRLEVLCPSPFDNIDAFSPLSKYKEYLECREGSKRLEEIREKAIKIFDRLIDKYPPGIGAKISKVIVRYVLLNFLRSTLDEFRYYNDLIENNCLVDLIIDSSEEALDKASRKKLGGKRAPRCVVYGHTHFEKIVPVGDGLYINDGCWMDKVAANDENPCEPNPEPNRHFTVLVKEEPIGDSTGESGTSTPAEPIVKVFMFTFPGPKLRLQGSYRLKGS